MRNWDYVGPNFSLALRSQLIIGMQKMSSKHGLAWLIWHAFLSTIPWVSLSLSPVALMTLLSNWHEWPIWVTAFTDFWDAFILPPFSIALGNLYHLLRINPPAIFTDYIVMGVVFTVSSYRAQALSGYGLIVLIRAAVNGAPRSDAPMIWLFSFIIIPFYFVVSCLFWPILVFMNILAILMGPFIVLKSGDVVARNKARRKGGLTILLTLAPFLAVGSIWAADRFW